MNSCILQVFMNLSIVWWSISFTHTTHYITQKNKLTESNIVKMKFFFGTPKKKLTWHLLRFIFFDFFNIRTEKNCQLMLEIWKKHKYYNFHNVLKLIKFQNIYMCVWIYTSLIYNILQAMKLVTNLLLYQLKIHT